MNIQGVFHQTIGLWGIARVNPFPGGYSLTPEHETAMAAARQSAMVQRMADHKQTPIAQTQNADSRESDDLTIAPGSI